MDSATRVEESGDSTDIARTRPGHAGLIRITSRLGVWGLIAALVPPMASELGGPMWLASLTPMVVAGLVTSGIPGPACGSAARGRTRDWLSLDEQMPQPGGHDEERRRRQRAWKRHIQLR